MSTHSASVIPLRDHVESLLEARDRTIEVQIRALTQVVKDAQRQGSQEHAEVRADIASMRTDVSTLRTDVTALQTSDATTHRLRSLDLAKVGVLASVLSLVAGFVAQH